MINLCYKDMGSNNNLLVGLCIVIWIQCALCNFSDQERTDADTSHVEAVENYNTSLPCTIRNPPRDQTIITLWYIGSSDMPFYSYDQRSPNHSSWVDTTVLVSRASFRADEFPPILFITHVSRYDAHIYKCRVDYSNSNSRVAWVDLKVVVPPVSIKIEMISNSILVGQNRDAVCRIYGGDPPSRIIWIQDSRVVDDTFTRNKGYSENVLDAMSTPGDLSKPFMCSGSNNDLTPPLQLEYQRNVTSSPSSVMISTKAEALVAKSRIKFLCTVIGSNPAATVTWFLENKEITKKVKTISKANLTQSWLDLFLTRKYHRNKIICRAENPLLVANVMEDVHTLNISYKPQAKLFLGRSLNPLTLKEGNDLFFECKVDSNPPPYKIEWLHEGKLLSHNVEEGVLVGEGSLALQQITKERSGTYQCVASNVEGDSVSNNVTISIKYTPQCLGVPMLRGVGIGETVTIPCIVDADPPNSTFEWLFNNSIRKDATEPIEISKYTQEITKSILQYTPHSDRDYGTLLCSATNYVGRQKEPCSYTLISAGSPESVYNCSYENLTSHSVNIICQLGFDGGLPQEFLLKVYDVEGRYFVFNKTNELPIFYVRPLEPGRYFKAGISSRNNKGTSKPVYISFHTQQEIAMHKILPSKVEPTPLLWVTGVIVGVMVSVLILIFSIHFIRRKITYARTRAAVTTLVLKENNPDLLNMDSSEDGLCEMGTNIHNNEIDTTNPKELAKYCTAQMGLDKREGPQYYNYERSMFRDVSPDITDKTRLTTPEEKRKASSNIPDFRRLVADQKNKDKSPDEPNINFRNTMVRICLENAPESTF